jgi:hypothetical protein
VSSSTVDLNPDAPHYPERTQQLADLAAEAVRTLNYATRGDDGLLYPGEAYSLLGELGILASRLPQLYDQIGDFLARGEAAGHLDETPDGPQHGNARLAVGDAIGALKRAVNDAETMTAAVKNAQSAIRAVRYVGPEIADDTEADL